MGGDRGWLPLIERLAMLRRCEPLSMGCQLPSEKTAVMHNRLRDPSRIGQHALKSATANVGGASGKVKFRSRHLRAIYKTCCVMPFAKRQWLSRAGLGAIKLKSSRTKKRYKPFSQ